MQNLIFIIPLFVLYLITRIIFREIKLIYYKKYKPQLFFNYSLELAKKGFFRHDGLLDSNSAQKLPQAKVKYSDGKFSVGMPIGNALDYAEIFDGEVVNFH